MPKKQQRNAFYFFMKELEPQLRREGRVFPNGMADVVPIAHPRWKQLPQKEKERFENMVKMEKARLRGRAGDQYRVDNVGNIIAHRKDKYTELEKRRMAEKRDIVANWPQGKELKKEKFYFINFQYLCKTEEKDYIYLPAEIGVIEYSIENGITRNLHRFIHPGAIPTGYRFSCIQNSEDTHKIPIENWELFDSNYRGLWIQLENFINPDRSLPENPPLYCLGAGNNYDVVEHCLEWIHGRACLGEPNRIRKVYEVESLFQEILAHVGRQVSKTQCIDWLTCSDWDYDPKTRCDYHEKEEVKHCALGIVNRYAYAMSASLCEQLFDVKLTKRHYPTREDVGTITVLSPSSMPVCKQQESRLPQKAEIGFKPKDPRPPPQEEEDYRELRRPNPPMADFPTSMPAAQAWGGAMGRGHAQVGNVYANQDFPQIAAGRGLTIGMQNLALDQTRPAGRASALRPQSAPMQQQAWPQQPFPQQPVGIGRGMTFRAPAPPVSTDSMSDDMPPLRRPGGAVGAYFQPGQFMDAENQQVASAIPPSLPVGRGKGGLLEGLLKNGRKPGAPVGRGFAPADWHDDGSLGPVRR